MDISRQEQKILHMLAQGGCIRIEKDDHRRISKIELFTREGWRFSGLSDELFHKLKRRKLIASKKSAPYRVTRKGLTLVRSQADNR
ncbi:YjhX family toxin [Pseudovibrio denitrificans]|uniref:YjhX family toxin n=1 Tax=Pseudovibrio denitrificans TaxID=258256 RepID=UPI0039BF042B